MGTLTSPQISVVFREKAKLAMARSLKGTAALIVRDAIADETPKTYVLRTTAQIPKELGVANQAAIRRVFQGGTGTPTKVLVYVMAAAGTVTSGCEALKWLGSQKWDYLAGHDELSTEEAQVIKTWIVQQRQDYGVQYKAVLPETAADNEAIINFTTGNIKADGETHTAAAYCGRIAGILAGCPMTQAGTYTILPEVQDMDRHPGADGDALVGKGQLILCYDGQKVKLDRAVNSLVTIAPPKQENWRKIKIMEIHDMISNDIRSTIKENYIGRVTNDYDHKMILVSAIGEYLGALAKGEGAIIGPDYHVDIDVQAQDLYLQSQGIPTADMSEAEIRQALTGSHVFITVAYQPLDVMEDVFVVIEL